MSVNGVHVFLKRTLFNRRDILLNDVKETCLENPVNQAVKDQSDVRTSVKNKTTPISLLTLYLNIVQPDITY